MKDILKKLNKVKTLKVGWFGNDNSMIPRLQEFGYTIDVTDKMRLHFANDPYRIKIGKNVHTMNVPPRPHRHEVIEKYASQWGNQFGKLFIKNKFDAEKTMQELGELIKAQYEDTLETGSFKPIQPFTKQVRRADGISGDKPLIATGTMKDNLEFRYGE